MNKITQLVANNANSKTIFVCVVLFVLNVLAFVFGFDYATTKNNDKVFLSLDKPVYSAVENYEKIANYTHEARSIHIWLTATADVAFPIIYSILFALLIVLLLQKTFNKYFVISVFPFFGAAADLCEGVGMVGLLLNAGQEMTSLMYFFIVAKAIKFIFFYASLAIILLLTVLYLFQKIKR